MEILLFVLFTTGKILYTTILVFLMAIPSGAGLGVGLFYAKKFIGWWQKKKLPTPDNRADKYADEFAEIEKDATPAMA